MRTETADEPLKEDLEDCSGDEGVEEADDGVVHIPEGANSDLTDQDDCNRDKGAEESCRPDGDDFISHGVCELWVDDLAILEVDWEGARRSWMCFVDLMGGQIERIVTGMELTPRPIIPMIAIVTMSSHVTLSHWPKLGLCDMFMTIGPLFS